MTDLNRRRFLQVAGGTAAASMMSGSIARAAALPANHRTRSLADVEHVVVLMQENRSFDHYFGTLNGVRGYGDPRPVTLPSGKPVWNQSDGRRDVLPFRPDVDDLGLQFVQDLPHSWSDTHSAWNHGKYDNWVPAKGTTTMAHMTREDIPFHYALADTFTICDAYHCSLMGSTDPNRYYMWSGYVGNDGVGGGPVIGNDEKGYGWTTYPERLEKAGVSWKIYQDVGDGLDAAGSWGWINDAYRGNYGDNSLLYFNQYRNAKPGDPLYDKARTGTDVKHGGGLFDGFKADVKAGKLPSVSWLVSPEAFTEHPNWPANYGAWYVSQVLDALTASPEVWSKTALFITYDENDGFFDHVVPPYPPASPAQGGSTVDTKYELNDGLPYGLGQRVPMLVVSPWSKGGKVCSEVFDHTSILRFLERRFGVRETNISPWRRAVVGDLTSAFDFSGTDSRVPGLPSTAGYAPPDRNRHPDYKPVPPANPALPKQEPGRRPALPLPYDLAADAKFDQGKLTVQFASHGAAGAVFYVTSATDQTGPWTYTVGAGQQTSASWKVSGAYDFTVHGPNGFFRQFTGPGAGVEVIATHARRGEELTLVLTNNGPSAATVAVRAAAGYGYAGPASHHLRPGARTVHTVRAGAAAGWYDVTVTAGTTTRRLAGHVECGSLSLTDPGLRSH
ncbi:phosphocholine-specific phospholipase C [Amycolatopsis sp. PS_44_ISF1]|uniref:phosphocholine-specific phospholipase C n=1 Tax=Amycolatopsis sp. PS_44_ISF1 TaxID=2974917 RepID=UPI0028E013E5|nr:phospholipase C, phosphocholine-specific [Amycolatopsis sp. PS_44_ISF1]MDT8913283.1 phospholipase C, phosphocholine-specific [Amycolatopsis sp. PS_44_ISF1]